MCLNKFDDTGKKIILEQFEYVGLKYYWSENFETYFKNNEVIFKKYNFNIKYSSNNDIILITNFRIKCNSNHILFSLSIDDNKNYLKDYNKKNLELITFDENKFIKLFSNLKTYNMISNLQTRINNTCNYPSKQDFSPISLEHFLAIGSNLEIIKNNFLDEIRNDELDKITDNREEILNDLKNKLSNVIPIPLSDNEENFYDFLKKKLVSKMKKKINY